MDATVFTRPKDKDKIVIARCDDGDGHTFELSVASAGTPTYKAVCGAVVKPTGDMEDDDPMCESCMMATEAWAMGGSLKLVTC